MAQYLPDLPLIEIFKHLGLVDLTRARAVSRRWRALIDSRVRIEELAICSKAISMPEKWFHLNKRVRPESWLELNVLNRDFSKFNQMTVRLQLFASLKRLSIVHPETALFDGFEVIQLFSRLCKFTALDHLEIDFNFDRCDGWSLDLVHPNLKVLSFGSLRENEEPDIAIDCLRLEILRCVAPFDRCTITYPETIKELHSYRFKEIRDMDWVNFASPSFLETFANVELYACDDSISKYAVQALDVVNIWAMPKLKELRVTITDWDDDHLNHVGLILTDLMAKKKSLGAARDSPKIYVNDKECSVNLRKSHPYLFPYWSGDEDSTDEDAADEGAVQDAKDTKDAAD